MMLYLKNFNKFSLNEAKITQSEIPNTMTFWHGGNLDEFKTSVSHKKGRYVYGAGLYLTTKYRIVADYTKGPRKLYKIVVEKGLDIDDSFIELEKAIEFVKSKVKVRERKTLIEIFKEKERTRHKETPEGTIPGYFFNNVILNREAISNTKTKDLREFIVECGIDYELDNKGDIMVLYNMDKIIETTRIMPNDEILTYDFRTYFA